MNLEPRPLRESLKLLGESLRTKDIPQEQLRMLVVATVAEMCQRDPKKMVLCLADALAALLRDTAGIEVPNEDRGYNP